MISLNQDQVKAIKRAIRKINITTHITINELNGYLAEGIIPDNVLVVILRAYGVDNILALPQSKMKLKTEQVAVIYDAVQKAHEKDAEAEKTTLNKAEKTAVSKTVEDLKIYIFELEKLREEIENKQQQLKEEIGDKEIDAKTSADKRNLQNQKRNMTLRIKAATKAQGVLISAKNSGVCEDVYNWLFVSNRIKGEKVNQLESALDEFNIAIGKSALPSGNQAHDLIKEINRVNERGLGLIKSTGNKFSVAAMPDNANVELDSNQKNVKNIIETNKKSKIEKAKGIQTKLEEFKSKEISNIDSNAVKQTKIDDFMGVSPSAHGIAKPSVQAPLDKYFDNNYAVKPKSSDVKNRATRVSNVNIITDEEEDGEGAFSTEMADVISEPNFTEIKADSVADIAKSESKEAIQETKNAMMDDINDIRKILSKTSLLDGSVDVKELLKDDQPKQEVKYKTTRVSFAKRAFNWVVKRWLLLAAVVSCVALLGLALLGPGAVALLTLAQFALFNVITIAVVAVALNVVKYFAFRKRRQAAVSQSKFLSREKKVRKKMRVMEKNRTKINDLEVKLKNNMVNASKNKNSIDKIQKELAKCNKKVLKNSRFIKRELEGVSDEKALAKLKNAGKKAIGHGTMISYVNQYEKSLDALSGKSKNKNYDNLRLEGNLMDNMLQWHILRRKIMEESNVHAQDMKDYEKTIELDGDKKTYKKMRKYRKNLGKTREYVKSVDPMPIKFGESVKDIVQLGREKGEDVPVDFNVNKAKEVRIENFADRDIQKYDGDSYIISQENEKGRRNKSTTQVLGNIEKAEAYNRKIEKEILEKERLEKEKREKEKAEKEKLEKERKESHAKGKVL